MACHLRTGSLPPPEFALAAHRDSAIVPQQGGQVQGSVFRWRNRDAQRHPARLMVDMVETLFQLQRYDELNGSA
ncbi:MAG TPA: hypothetical protein VHO69_07200 [Phototrophicaceae bacterium]|nr:hypothetical protein [Phototrophicaceae bacterium]